MLIVTGSDNNYVPGVMVLIASAAFHNPSARFAVLDMGISSENRNRIDQLAARLEVKIKRIEVESDAFANLVVRRAHLNQSAYLRLLIPNLFPEDDRVIYMDSDMVVMDDLTPLEQIDLSDNIIAAVACPCPNPRELAATGHVLGSYINSGLLVMNLPIWRNEKLVDKCLDLLAAPDHPRLCEDQSAINIMARGRIKMLPGRYNIYSDPTSYRKLENCPQRPAVVHYVVNNKPWGGQANLSQLWQFHADRIADLLPERRSINFRRRLSLLNRSRKQFLGLLMGRPKYRMRRQMVRHMNQTLAQEYLQRATSQLAKQASEETCHPDSR